MLAQTKMKMKKVLFTVQMICFSLMLFAQDFTLSIDNGHGAGTYLKGKAVHVWAKKPFALEVFVSWSGSGADFLANKSEWHTTLNIPNEENASNFELIANFEALIDAKVSSDQYLQFGERNNDGVFFETSKTIFHAVPEVQSKNKIVMLFHGTGGNAESWFKRYERQILVKDFLQNGYNVFSISSNETDMGDQNGDGQIRWQIDLSKPDIESNIDLLNVSLSVAQVKEKFGLEGAEVFLIGGSNGANFSDFCAAALAYKASAHMTGNGQSAVFQNHKNLKPIIWLQAINDNNPSADSLKALANYSILLEQDICTEWHWHERSPLYPLRFTRSTNNINNALSISIFEKLEANGFLDDEAYLTVANINQDFPFDEFIEEFNLSQGAQKDVLDQLNAANADHGSFSDFNKTILSFFESCDLVNEVATIDEKEENCIIYPNPFHDELWLSNKKVKAYKLYELSGRLLKSASFNGKLNLSSLTNGTYILELTFEKGNTIYKKIIKN